MSRAQVTASASMGFSAYDPLPIGALRNRERESP
jgi:hypothetical protein